MKGYIDSDSAGNVYFVEYLNTTACKTRLLKPADYERCNQDDLYRYI